MLISVLSVTLDLGSIYCDAGNKRKYSLSKNRYLCLSGGG
jgi:hypothetical protein